MKNPLNKYAFFFQGDSLLLPPDVPNWEIDREIPIEFADIFEDKDIFEIPDLENYSDDGKESQNSGSPKAETHAPLITGVSVAPEEPLPPRWTCVTVRNVLFMLTDGIEWKKSVVRMLRTFHVAQWRRNSCYCGKCGTKNVDVVNNIARECPSCGKLEFPAFWSAA